MAEGGGIAEATGANGSGGEPESSDSMRTFGAFVQALREHAGLSRQELGNHVGFSKHTVASIELGRRMPDVDFVERAESVLGETGALRKAFRHLTRKQGLAAWFRRWASMEGTAISLCTYECRLVPGLLQTEAYARTLFEHRLPLLSDEEVDAQLAARFERQRLLADRPHTAFSFILEEHLFRRLAGGAEGARELINYVLGAAQRRNVEVQILPLSSGLHAGMDGPMRLLETTENHWFAYSEGQETGQLIADPKAVSVLQRRYAKLRSQALTPEDSRGLLQRLRGEL
ncbi:helix-turn-helix domain-containing protein [Streptomyces sp. NBC_01476]|uniref:helix-turn-helix domain-containing protein n=1 Tax=Streptomyces sp. NBC_01476 TaxID=2903881 RepID=UPI002E3304C8|nr:helix-turn-helix transcriptional regulator [Streptomyces sp. NBC_01476]